MARASLRGDVDDVRGWGGAVPPVCADAAADDSEMERLGRSGHHDCGARVLRLGRG